MENSNAKTPHYGNWVSTQLIKKCVIMVLLFTVAEAALCTFVSGFIPLKIILILLTVFFLTGTVYFCRSRYLFSPEGGDVQNKVLETLISHIDWNGIGKVLDIGCGSAALTLKLARKYPEACVSGIDYWGKGWGYCKKQCEENAIFEGVAGRTDFQQASASKLPFSDGTFDLVVSNLTFHEVKDSKNKIDVVKEALRVLKPGGRFVFQDLFLLERYYGTPEELVSSVKGMGASNVHFVDTSKSSFIPGALKLPFMIGTLGLIYGEK
jgi:SAM-dependent methyltransferase